jgi:hypothetical protein
LRRIGPRLSPDLKEGFLEHVIRFRFFLNDITDHPAEQSSVPSMELVQSLMLSLHDFFHEDFVGLSRMFGNLRLILKNRGRLHPSSSKVLCRLAISARTY